MKHRCRSLKPRTKFLQGLIPKREAHLMIQREVLARAGTHACHLSREAMSTPSTPTQHAEPCHLLLGRRDHRSRPAILAPGRALPGKVSHSQTCACLLWVGEFETATQGFPLTQRRRSAQAETPTAMKGSWVPCPLTSLSLGHQT